MVLINSLYLNFLVKFCNYGATKFNFRRILLLIKNETIDLMRKLIVCLLVVTAAAGCKKIEVVPVTETPTDSGPLPAQQMPAMLPRRVAFGAEGDIAKSAQFIAESDYQYQYLSGDIFSNGWTTWNAPDGEFARNFLNRVSQMGKVPVFTYYNLVPAKNRFEDPAFTNMNDAEVMKRYFDDFKFLLQICGAFAKPVIIHYEPDLMGYMEMYRNDVAKSSIKVSQSGQPDVQGFSNNAKGLFEAIVAMRNKYAPNVLLGWHASQWATGNNLVVDKHNPEQLGKETADYYKSLHAPFDLIFSEFSDRDAGYDEVVMGKTNVEWSAIASAANGNLSDYSRFQRFLKTLNQQTGQKIILWQIPVGNTFTKTCNNTPGHYKNNTAEYFLQQVLAGGTADNIASYGQAGVIAFLFGRGAANCTSYMDDRHDDADAPNETADDDGGYLRKGIRAYYQKGVVAVQ